MPVTLDTELPLTVRQHVRKPPEPSPAPIKEPPDAPENPDAPVREPDPDEPGQMEYVAQEMSVGRRPL